jgi:hypothetical protein
MPQASNGIARFSGSFITSPQIDGLHDIPRKE